MNVFCPICKTTGEVSNGIKIWEDADHKYACFVEHKVVKELHDVSKLLTALSSKFSFTNAKSKLDHSHDHTVLVVSVLRVSE